GIEFAYQDDYLRSGRPPVATTLPLTDQPVVTSSGAVPPYFAGLLPEGRRLGALRRAVKTSADDELSLLLAVGADAIGDVQVVAAGVTPAEMPRTSSARRAGWSSVSVGPVAGGRSRFSRSLGATAGSSRTRMTHCARWQ